MWCATGTSAGGEQAAAGGVLAGLSVADLRGGGNAAGGRGRGSPGHRLRP